MNRNRHSGAMSYNLCNRTRRSTSFANLQPTPIVTNDPSTLRQREPRMPTWYSVPAEEESSFWISDDLILREDSFNLLRLSWSTYYISKLLRRECSGRKPRSAEMLRSDVSEVSQVGFKVWFLFLCVHSEGDIRHNIDYWYFGYSKFSMRIQKSFEPLS